MLAVQLASRSLGKTGGNLVLMSSAAANIGLPNHDAGEAVAAAKAGVIGLGQAAAASFSKKDIRVNVVAPGLTHTPLAEKALGEPGIKASTHGIPSAALASQLMLRGLSGRCWTLSKRGSQGLSLPSTAA